jgi:hypothetical protein
MEEKMRVLTQSELNRCTRQELLTLLRRIAGELPNLKEGSPELQNAHINLRNIRMALSAPRPSPW